jgi:hypothetical protein
MSVEKNAIIIAEDGGKIDDPTIKYDSRRATLIVDIDRDPKHMQIVETGGGTNYTDGGGVGRHREILYEMSHNLGYIPLVDAYFYAKSYNGSETHVKTGLYGNDFLLFSGSAGTIADVFSFEVDDKNFRIVHYLDEYGFATGYTSDAASYVIRTKFYIYSIDTGRTAETGGYPYDGSGTAIE